MGVRYLTCPCPSLVGQTSRFFVFVLDFLSATNLERGKGRTDRILANLKNGCLFLAGIIRIVQSQIMSAFLGEQHRKRSDAKRGYSQGHSSADSAPSMLPVADVCDLLVRNFPVGKLKDVFHQLR